MKWLNLETSTLRAPEFVGSDPTARATWLCVLAYCVDQENSGVIANADKWPDRQWQQTCGVTKQEIDSSFPLLQWKENALWVWAYPVSKQQEVQAKRYGGAKGGRSTSEAKAEAARINGAKHDPSSTQAGTQRKGKERKGMEYIARSEDLAIYDAYPRKVGREAALKAIAKAQQQIDASKLLERVQRYAAATSRWSDTDKRFIPHPATWFNQGRYADDPQTWNRNEADQTGPRVKLLAL
jgi:hypothetical protein